MFRAEDYERENRETRPKNARVSTKTRLPSTAKSSTHPCSQCPSSQAIQYPISEKETRWLCDECVQKALRKDRKEKPNYVKASQLRRDV